MSALSDRHLRSTAIGLTALAALAILLEAPGAARVGPVLGWALLAPGLAVVPALRLDHAIGQLAAAVGISLATTIIAAEVMLYLGVGDARWAFAAVAVVTLTACVIPFARERRAVPA